MGLGSGEDRPWRHIIFHGDHAKDSKELNVKSNEKSDTWESAHQSCRPSSHDQKISLSILRCCRHTYQEANRILWSTNTFAIHDAATLQLFMNNRTPTQKRHMRSIRLRFDLTMGALQLRRSILTYQLMQSLSGLHTLHLILEVDLPDKRLSQDERQTKTEPAEFGGYRIRIDPGFENLPLLPLRKVFVEIHPRATSTELLDGEDRRYIELWKKEYIERVKSFLLSRQNQLRQLRESREQMLRILNGYRV